MQRITLYIWFVLSIVLLPLVKINSQVQAGIPYQIDLTIKNTDHVLVLSGPDSPGSVSQRKIVLPPFKTFSSIAADSVDFRWIGASNRLFPWIGNDNLQSIFNPKNPLPPLIQLPNRRSFMMIFKLFDDSYLTLLPLSGKASVSWLEVNVQGELTVDYNTLGKNNVAPDSDVPLLAWYRSVDVYESLHKVWELALNHPRVHSTTSMRWKRTVPIAFNYLGWCTWEQYRKNINEQTLVNAMADIEKSEIPVRWVLIDDGHQYDQGRLLRSLTPNKEKFPNGWDPVISKTKENGIKWMGLWHGFLSHWDGVYKEHDMPELKDYLMPNPLRKNGLLPKDTPIASLAFYEHLVETVKEQGFDFIKTDNVSRSLLEYSGAANAVAAHRNNILALETACHDFGIGLMNCSAQNTVDLLNTKYSTTMRSSPDYQKNVLETSKSQILQSLYNVLWLGQTLWPDHDMFHSSDSAVAKTMSVTKAISGGPVYLSDDPAEFVPDVIKPLCYNNGELIRPEAPGVPMPESIFEDALYSTTSLFKTITPLKNKSCAIVAYNLSLFKDKVLKGTILPADYKSASAMLQPYNRQWTIPTEGVVVYDWIRGKGRLLDQKGISFSLNGFGHQLFLLSPVQNNWAVIGRPDKYLAPSTVEIHQATKESVIFTMVEPGNVIIYLKNGIPYSDQFKFTAVGNGFYEGVLKGILNVKKFVIYKK